MGVHHGGSSINVPSEWETHKLNLTGALYWGVERTKRERSRGMRSIVQSKPAVGKVGQGEDAEDCDSDSHAGMRVDEVHGVGGANIRDLCIGMWVGDWKGRHRPAAGPGAPRMWAS